MSMKVSVQVLMMLILIITFLKNTTNLYTEMGIQKKRGMTVSGELSKTVWVEP